MLRSLNGLVVIGALAVTTMATFGAPQDKPAPVGYDDTPMQPNGQWRIHDPARPQPVVVTPGAGAGFTAPPQDAIILLGTGTDLSAWQMVTGSAPNWHMRDGILERGRGDIVTKDQFTGTVQLHVEFATPSTVEGNSQERGNSGVFFGAFEIQVLDSFDNRTYADGSAAAMYGQFPPLVNASRRPGEWQGYDIVFAAPRFDGAGRLEAPAVITLLHNGVLVHHAQAFWGPTLHKAIGTYQADQAKFPIRLQDHGNAVRFRNIWIRTLQGR